MKICILLPRFNKNPFVYDDKDNDKNYNYMFPLGLSYISASLKQNNYDVNFINLNHYKGLIKDIIDCEFKKNKYDFVFTGSLSFYYPNIKDYVKYIREISPTTKIVLGGGIISSQPTIMFNLIKPDYIVIGEGEQTVVELLKCIQTNGDLTQINGIGYINNNILIFTKPREPILNLDSLPFPDYESCGLDEYLNHLLPTNYIGFDTFDTPRIYPLLMSRSCPFECTFCYHQLGQKYRQRSIDNILDEIQFAVIKYKINIFTFYDELFSHDRSRIIDFCTKFNELRKTLPWVIKWNCALRVDNIDDELVKIMKNSGCFMISFGLESYSNVILKSMKKHITPEQINNAIHIVSNNNIAIQGTFIFGDPAETLETAQNTLNYFKHNQNILKGGVQLGFIMLFQGSPLYKYCLSNGTITNEINFIENRASNGYIFHKPQKNGRKYFSVRRLQ